MGPQSSRPGAIHGRCGFPGRARSQPALLSSCALAAWPSTTSSCASASAGEFSQPTATSPATLALLATLPWLWPGCHCISLTLVCSYRKIMCNLDIIKRRLCNALEQTGGGVPTGLEPSMLHHACCECHDCMRLNGVAVH